MQQMNKVELIGTVGSVRMIQVGEVRGANFSLVTCYTYVSDEGGQVYETTWHNVVCFEGDRVCALSDIGKGVSLRVIGRLRNRRYIAENGAERMFTEIMASAVELLKDVALEPER